MELRILKYFVSVVDEGSITEAAKVLHVTQPTLSRQLAQMEAELGTPLFLRGRNGIALTERGAILNRYARSILDLASKAEEEVAIPHGDIVGTVRIGAGETRAFSLVAEACARVHKNYPGVSFDIHDGTSADLKDSFARGFYDFLLDCNSGENLEFNQITLPIGDRLGVVMRTDDPLANKDSVSIEDLAERELIATQQMVSQLRRLFAEHSLADPRVVANQGLPFNSKYLVLAGVGLMFTFDELVNGPHGQGDLRFRPLFPYVEIRHKVLWRKVMPTKPAQVFIDELCDVCEAARSRLGT